MLNETMELAKADARDAWDGEGYYAIGWSDGGMDWTSNGPVWFDTEDELAEEICAAYFDATETHLPGAEKERQFQQYELDALLGDFKDDFDVEGIIGETTQACSDGNRYWTVDEDELVEVLKEFEK